MNICRKFLSTSALIISICFGIIQPASAQNLSNDIVLPVEFIGNRIFVQPVTEPGDTIHFLHDTGGGTILLTERAVEKLNLEVVQDTMEGQPIDLANLPSFTDEAYIPLYSEDFENKDAPYLSQKTEWLDGKIMIMPEQPGYPVEAFGDGVLGQDWFATRIWTFDYINKKVILHDAEESDKKNNSAEPIYFAEDENGFARMHFPRIQATIGNESYDFLFDTGATLILNEEGMNAINDNLPQVRGTSYITSSTFEKWSKANPGWKVIENAEEFTGARVIEVPEVTIAGYTVGPVWFTERPDENFHTYMSRFLDKEVEGALGGSLFQYFRITLNYPERFARFSID